MKTKANLFAALALVVMTGFFNPVGVPEAMAQAAAAVSRVTGQVGGETALNAIRAALDAQLITSQAAAKLTSLVEAGGTVALQNGVLVTGAAAAAGLGAGFAAGNVAAVVFVAAGVLAVVTNDTDATVATTGTTGTR